MIQIHLIINSRNNYIPYETQSDCVPTPGIVFTLLKTLIKYRQSDEFNDKRNTFPVRVLYSVCILKVNTHWQQFSNIEHKKLNTTHVTPRSIIGHWLQSQAAGLENISDFKSIHFQAVQDLIHSRLYSYTRREYFNLIYSLHLRLILDFFLYK